MNGFAFSSDRPLRVLISAHTPELKAHVSELVSRAYFNIHGKPIATAEPAWANAIIATAVHICADERVQHKPTRDLIHIFEDVIRVSEEHLRESRRHASMASNAFYLRETVLDNALAREEAAPVIRSAQGSVVHIEVAHMARLRDRPNND